VQAPSLDVDNGVGTSTLDEYDEGIITLLDDYIIDDTYQSQKCNDTSSDLQLVPLLCSRNISNGTIRFISFLLLFDLSQCVL
jgi:hypothetical protein